MSRPGRFALRVLGVTAVSFALMAPASFGQTVSLSGETFETVPALGQQTTYGPFTCNKTGTTVIPFETEGFAFGPYSGMFTESGTITIGPQTDLIFDSRGTGDILDFQASFTISSQFPTGTVTGTKQLAPTAPGGGTLEALGRCDPDGSSPPDSDLFAIVSNPFLVYDAQINAATGSRTDSGTSGVLTQSLTNTGAPTTFQEAFTSTEPVPPECEDGNNGNGVGGGHPKKNNDNDDNEHCR
jgi:hypothetical protein